MAQITTQHEMRGTAEAWPSVADIKEFIAGLPDDAEVVLSVLEDRNLPADWVMRTNRVPIVAPRVQIKTGTDGFGQPTTQVVYEPPQETIRVGDRVAGWTVSG